MHLNVGEEIKAGFISCVMTQGALGSVGTALSADGFRLTCISVFSFLVAEFIFLFSGRTRPPRRVPLYLYFHFGIEMSWPVIHGALCLFLNGS